jgi:hypothetical protein
MRAQIKRRLHTLEVRLPDDAVPIRSTVPMWILEELKPQGLRYDSNGIIEWDSLRSITGHGTIDHG